MRKIYALLSYLAIPFLVGYLKKRGRANPDYLNNWHERFGVRLVNPSSKPIIWLHSVSVGETRAMQRLVAILEQQFPNFQLLITTMTPTGRATARSLYPHALVHYIPYDFSYAVKKFYATFQPQLGLILETEIWPNLIHFGAQQGIPLYLINARLSDKSARGYQRFKWALMPILNQLRGILCQDQTSLANFKALNYQGLLQVIGNTKFDLALAPGLEAKINQFKHIFAARKVICFASTRDGEEQLFLENIDLNQDVTYLFIPRHPERFQAVENLWQQRGLSYQKRSQLQQLDPTNKLVLGDSMGEMLAYYAISYLVVMGGSFTDCGGQNPIEALYMTTPVIFGPSMFNFKQVAQDSLAAGCAIQVNEVAQLSEVIANLITNPETYAHLRHAGTSFVTQYAGASQRIFEIIQPELATQAR